MLKKFFLALAVVASLVVAAPMETASADSYYMGTYSNGGDAYLLSETVNIFSWSPLKFNCTVYDGSYLYYRFFQRSGSPYYTNSAGYEGYVFGGASPIAANIYNFVRNNY